MADQFPFRLRVMRGVTSTLEAISKADGYAHDLAGRVFRGRAFYGDNDPIPMVSILEAPLPDDPDNVPFAGPHWKGPWRLMIQGWVDDDRFHPTDPAYYLLADVRRALAKARMGMLPKNNLFGMDGSVTDIMIGACVVRPADEQVNEKANFLLSVTLEIAENMADPYA